MPVPDGFIRGWEADIDVKVAKSVITDHNARVQQVAPPPLPPTHFTFLQQGVVNKGVWSDSLRWR